MSGKTVLMLKAISWGRRWLHGFRLFLNQNRGSPYLSPKNALMTSSYRILCHLGF